jgi:hypothetical protein
MTNFERFTQTTPAGAEGPDVTVNPIIGPDPLAETPPADSPPGVMLGLNGHHTTGSFLLDTGGAATIIAEQLAADLEVRYRDGHGPGSDQPLLETFDGQLLDDQFTLPLSGIAGSVNIAGFFLDSLLVRTAEGDEADPDDPQHLNYLDVPVLVADITVVDPDTQEPFTLDGVFGMNLLFASIFIDGSVDLFSLGDAPLSAGAFDWVVYDQPGAQLGLALAEIPEPASGALLLAGVTWLLRRPRRWALYG